VGNPERNCRQTKICQDLLIDNFILHNGTLHCTRVHCLEAIIVLECTAVHLQSCTCSKYFLKYVYSCMKYSSTFVVLYIVLIPRPGTCTAARGYSGTRVYTLVAAKLRRNFCGEPTLQLNKHPVPTNANCRGKSNARETDRLFFHHAARAQA
jgi:hypothetical protein